MRSVRGETGEEWMLCNIYKKEVEKSLNFIMAGNEKIFKNY